jgi:2-polyprenyl-3-methyl-5-hydroxy-6-metoxy-1,4-benzoquinol methylase
MPPSWNFKRVDRPELMDTRDFPPETVRETLRFLSLTNRRFGGADVVLRHLKGWRPRWPKGPVTLLDVGTGGGDIALAVARWARSEKVDMRITAVDLIPSIADIARENTRDFPEITVMAGDAFSLPGPFDHVTASLFLHHVPPPENVAAVRRLDRLSRRGLIISDLERSLPSFLAVTLLSWAAGNGVVRHDGPLSVRRAFTLPEMEALGRHAGLPHLKARKEPWFRLSLAGEK